jgi:hypothetical protein
MVVDRTDRTDADQTADALLQEHTSMHDNGNGNSKCPSKIIVPDGVSPPIKHPLDPLNAGKAVRVYCDQ